MTDDIIELRRLLTKALQSASDLKLYGAAAAIEEALDEIDKSTDSRRSMPPTGAAGGQSH